MASGEKFVASVGRREVLVGALAGFGLAAVAAAATTPKSTATHCDAQLDPGPAVQPLPDAAPAHEGTVEVDGASIWYWDTGGAGEPIVLLHPLTGSGLVWGYQQPVFARAGYRVIGYSRRGFHNSNSGDAARPGTGAGDLRALLDALNIKRCHLVGSAGGAFVVADFALSFPERLYSQVLACSMLGIQGGPVAEINGRLRPEGFEKLPQWCQELSASYRAVDADGTQRWCDLQSNSRTPGSGPPMQPTLQPLTLDLLAQVKVPTLVLSGAADLLAPPPVGRLIARTIPGSELALLPECGHSGYWERPELFNRIVLEFVARHAGVNAHA